MGLFSLAAGAVVPSSWLGGEAGEPAAAPVVVDERVTTLGYAADQRFARVSVLWVEVDGERLTEDAWGEGHLDQIRFKVGIKRAEGNSLRMGERTVALEPTDVLTIRDFHGRFSFSGVGTADAAVALDGSVKNTLVQDGSDGAGLFTKGPQAQRAAPGPGSAPDRLAYVVLDTGQAVGTVEKTAGAAGKVLTAGAEAAGTATALDVRWVKVDGDLVTRYAFGEGEAARIEFEPDARFTSSLAFDDGRLVWDEGDRVVVREFLGVWSVVLRPGGGARLKLDGWAGHAEVLDGEAVANSNPDLAFTFAPLEPSTRDLVTFTADANDPDGAVHIYSWTFLRKLDDAASHTPDDLLQTTATGRSVEHRFTRPGTWEIALRVVDDRGGVSTVTQDIVVANTAPTAAFDWFPNSPVTLEKVRFYDRSVDLDGTVVSRAWSFGDGTTSAEKEPVKSYAKNGLYNVTLTVTDSEGGVAVTRQILAVQNAPPDCSFELNPPDPTAFQVTTLIDRSADREGPIAAWSWTVTDLENLSAPVAMYTGATAEHTFTAANLHKVALSVTDADGAKSTCAIEVDVRNTPPVAGFAWWPATPVTKEFTYLNATCGGTTVCSNDADGRIVKYEWTVEGDPEVKRGDRIGYAFPRADAFDVTLTVTDNGGLTSTITQEVTIANSPPVASFVWQPATPRTGEKVVFTNTSHDLDGDAQVRWDWTFGPGETASGPQAQWAFHEDGPHNVSLTVWDDEGNSRTVTKSILVLNRLPTATIAYEPNPAVVGSNITFSADGNDPDGDVVRYEWLFGDGGRAEGSTVSHAFASSGRHEVKLVLTDDDDGQAEIPLTLDVRRAGPTANFSFAPAIGATGRPSQFQDLSSSGGAPLTTWRWEFGDGSTSAVASPAKTYSLATTYTVKLTVTDEDGTASSLTRSYEVTNPPVAKFKASTLTPKNGESVTFADESYDPDGTIASRAWKIDGAEVSTDATFAHTFNVRGPHAVQLTVVDDRGVASHRFENITVQNVLPVADFTQTPTRAIEGQTVTFQSTATDADGVIDVPKTVWRLRNNEVPNPSTDKSQFSTVLSAGIVSVGLTVTDDAGGQHSVTKQVPVYADHPATYEVRVRYADGSVPPLDPFDVSFTNRRTGEGYRIGSGVVLDATNGVASLTLGTGEWVPGDSYRIDGFGLTGHFTHAFTTTSQDQTLTVLLVVYPRVVDTPTLTIRPGTQPGALSGLPNLVPLGEGPGAYYASTFEPFRGDVAATWTNPSDAVEGGFVQVWVNRSVTYGFRVPAIGADVSVPLFSTKTTGYTDATGRFAFEAPFSVAALGMNAPGWYTVDVHVSWPDAIGRITPGRTTGYVYVDVEGLFQAVANRALP